MHEIEYLGYILTRDGIKPQPEKVQAILMLNPPDNVKVLRHFQGMELSLSFGDNTCPLVNVCIAPYVGRVTWSHT